MWSYFYYCTYYGTTTVLITIAGEVLLPMETDEMTMDDELKTFHDDPDDDSVIEVDDDQGIDTRPIIDQV